MDGPLGLSEEGDVREWTVRVQPALLCFFLLLTCLEALRWSRCLGRGRGPPGPFPWPVVGNALQLGSSPHLTFARMARQYGDIFQIRLGRHDIVVLNGDATIRQALVKHNTQFAGRPDFASFRIVSGGRSVAFGRYSAVWRAHRRVAQATVRAFSTVNTHTRKLFEKHVVNEASDLIQEFLRLGADGRRCFDPSREVMVANANVLCALCFGKRYSHSDSEFRDLLTNIESFGRTVGAGSLVDVMPWLQAFPNPVRTMYRDFKRLNEEFFTFVSGKVGQHRQTYVPGHTRDMSDAFINVIHREAAARDGLSREHVEGSVNDVMGAGQDTTSTALSWVLFHLIRYPDIQTRLQEEIDGVVGRERLPGTEDRPRLPYVQAFIFEVIRFTSFVPLTIPHATTSQVTINGYHIPKDTVVFINQWSVNHDQSKWEDVDRFEPRRFLNQDGSINRDLINSVMIFSAGKRRCIGDQLAKMQMFLFTAILIHQCSFEPNPEGVLSLDGLYGLSIKPLPFTLRVRLRDTYRGIVSPA